MGWLINVTSGPFPCSLHLDESFLEGTAFRNLLRANEKGINSSGETLSCVLLPPRFWLPSAIPELVPVKHKSHPHLSDIGSDL